MEDTLRRQHEEDQYARRMGTRKGNFAAYQTEAQTQVGVAGAEALGKMGSNDAGGVDLGSGGADFNPVAMMAGMAVGGAVGQNITGTMNGMMNGATQQNTMTPPPYKTFIELKKARLFKRNLALYVTSFVRKLLLNRGLEVHLTMD